MIFNFMRLPKDVETEKDTTHMAIAKRYCVSGKFLIHFLATFPFFLIQFKNEKHKPLYFKFFRLTRVPRIITIFDMDKFQKLSDCFFEGTARGRRVILQNLMKNSYKVFRLILMTVLITYFIGCTFYFVSSMQ